MVGPIESESKADLDRFCTAFGSVRSEVEAVGCIRCQQEHAQAGALYRGTRGGPEWDQACSRETAAYPTDWVREDKFWPSFRRVDDAYGDRNLFCSCLPTDAYDAEDRNGLAAALQA